MLQEAFFPLWAYPLTRFTLSPLLPPVVGTFLTGLGPSRSGDVLYHFVKQFGVVFFPPGPLLGPGIGHSVVSMYSIYVSMITFRHSEVCFPIEKQ